MIKPGAVNKVAVLVELQKVAEVPLLASQILGGLVILMVGDGLKRRKRERELD